MPVMNKKIVHTVFEATAERFPDRIAVETGSRSISYSALKKASDTIACRLRAAGVQKEVIAGIVLKSGIEYVATIIGVLKAGGIFLPLDMEFPDKRLEYILNTTAPGVVITGKEDCENVLKRFHTIGFGEKLFTIFAIDDNLHLSRIRKTDVPEDSAISEDLGLPGPDDSNYIMYTSGSTGEPKAIVGSHKSLSHFMHWEVQEFGFDEQVKVSQFPPVTFDASLRDIFVPLITGGRVCIPDKEVKTNVKHLIEWIERTGVTLIHCVPSLFRLITKELESTNGTSEILPDLKYILMAGEPLYGRDINRWMNAAGERIKLVNLYGASETTLIKSFHRIEKRYENPNTIIPVGKPISNTALLVINGNKLCEIGEAGEIFIKTPFMTKGYYRNPEMTKKSFVPNPLNPQEDDIVYKTGDMGRYAPDRSVEFIGRLDTQVKVNGVRIELGEIEKALINCKSIDQAVVLAHKNRENENTLSCYYTEKTPIGTEALRAHLHQYLPDYMLPSFYVRLDEFPLNINGKIDKKALPKPEELMYETVKYEPPANDLEEKLAQIWGDVLDIKKIGVNSNFYEIGGHSLKATRIISKVLRELKREISLKDFFEHSTIRRLATFLTTVESATCPDIQPLKAQGCYGLSHAQRRLWVLDQMEEEGLAYMMSGAFLFEGSLDVSLFLKVFESLVERHESLRTIFTTEDGVPKQQILEYTPGLKTFDFSVIDIRPRLDQKPGSRPERLNIAVEELIGEYAKQGARTPFDLSRGPLIRIQLLKLSGHSHAALFHIHHIIGDAWSLDVLAKELVALYDAHLSGSSAPLPPLKIQYKDYAAWQNSLLASERVKNHADYWHTKLSGEIPILDLPVDFPRPHVQSYRGGVCYFILGEELAAGLASLAKAHDASLFMCLLAMVKIQLHLYTGQEDIIVGSPVAGRNHPDLENQVGFYVNTLALRDAIHGRDSFTTTLERVKRTTIEAYDHQLYPFDRLVDELNLARDVSRAPLFDVMVVHQNDVFSERSAKTFTITELDIELETSRFDLTFIFKETEKNIRVGVNYNSGLFTRETVERIGTHFENLIKSVLAGKDRPISELDVLGERERQKVLIDFNNNKHPYPEDKNLIDLFEEQVKKTPDSVAVIFYDRKITYSRLHEWKDRLARHLIDDCGVRAGDLVGLMIGRSDWSVLCLLGILKAGAVYLPLDPAYPQKRIDYMLKNSRCKALITEDEYRGAAFQDSTRIVDLEKIKALLDEKPNREQPLPRIEKNPVACVYYTSGSSGTPKGVRLGHSGYVNMSLALIRCFHLTEHDRVLQFASYSFDVSMSEIFITLLSGGAIVVADKEKIDDPQAFLSYLEQTNVTVAMLSPGYLNALDRNRLKTLRILISGGEPPLMEDVCYYREKAVYYNAYGPTEASVCTTIHKVSRDKSYAHVIPIGKPISNVSVYIVNNGLKPVPIGVRGEITISGAGLALDYLDQPELTKEKFVSNPFSPGGQLYRTGDLGRWLPDGEIEFLGRKDEQVKVRGFRIELGEIENSLLRHPSVKEAVVIKNRGSDDLAAYIVCNGEVTAQALKSHCQTFLPDYMIPSIFVPLKNIPLTVEGTGKIDRKALPSPDAAGALSHKTEYVAPRNGLETRLAGLWEKILGRNRIGMYDNFFELGGTSLNSVQLASSVSITFNVHISAKTLFLNPTIEKLAVALGQTVPVDTTPEKTTAACHRYVSPAVASIERNPLSALIDSGLIAPVDSSALECFPDNLAEDSKVGRDEIINGWCRKLPVVIAVTETFLGRIASIVVPHFNSELFDGQNGLHDSMLQAMDVAGKIGSRAVSLTGLLASATDYGKTLVSSGHFKANAPEVTTGHGTITATLIMNVERILKDSCRQLRREKVGFVGLGSIGTAALRLLLTCLPHPKEIILFDVFQRNKSPEQIKQELKKDLHFHGVVRSIAATQKIPDEFYAATLIIGATNAPNILDVEKVKPGTLIVNDSGRTCFSLNAAIQRLESRKDILFTEGDVLHSPRPIKRSVYLPQFVEEGLGRETLESFVAFNPNLITGCVLSGLLSAGFKEIKPVTGAVELDTCVQNFHLLKQQGFKAAHVHYERYEPPKEIITHFTNQYGCNAGL